MLKIQSAWRTASAFALLATSAAWAADVKVEGVHLCCGGCVKAAKQALSKADGVSNVSIDKDAETISFTSANDAGTEHGLTALADAGFYGKTSVPGPDFKIDAKTTANEVHISKLHLCCGGCVDTAEGALEKLPGVKSLDANSKEGKITLKGEKINLAAALKALHEAGMHGKVE